MVPAQREGTSAIPYNRFGHFLFVLVQNKTMEVDGFERDFAGSVKPHHYHSRDPEEENVGGGFHYGCWVKILEVLAVFTVILEAKSEVWPLCRREPGVKDVGVLDPAFFFWRFFSYVYFVFFEPCWNSDAPGDLAGDVPVP